MQKAISKIIAIILLFTGYCPIAFGIHANTNMNHSNGNHIEMHSTHEMICCGSKMPEGKKAIKQSGQKFEKKQSNIDSKIELKIELKKHKKEINLNSSNNSPPGHALVGTIQLKE